MNNPINQLKKGLAALAMPALMGSPLAISSCARPVAGIEHGTIVTVNGKREFVGNGEVVAAAGESGSFTKSSSVTVGTRKEVCKDGKCGSSKTEVYASNTVTQESGSTTFNNVLSPAAEAADAAGTWSGKKQSKLSTGPVSADASAAANAAAKAGAGDHPSN